MIFFFNLLFYFLNQKKYQATKLKFIIFIDFLFKCWKFGRIWFLKGLFYPRIYKFLGIIPKYRK